MILLFTCCTIPCWLAWLISGLLGLLMGYLIWGRLKSRITELETELAQLKKHNSKLEGDLSDCSARRSTAEASLASVESDLALMKGRIKEGSLSLSDDGDSSSNSSEIGSNGGSLGIMSEDSADGDLIDDVHIADGNSSSAVGIMSETATKEDIPKDTGSADGDSDDKESHSDDSADANENSSENDSSSDSDDATQENDETSSGSGIAGTVAASAGAMGVVSDRIDNYNSSDRDDDIYGVFESNDLQIVEGIGPKMEEVLNNAGVHTWSDLSGKSSSELRGILDSAGGDKYKIINPDTWAQQAKLADRGHWDELVSAQKQLDGGTTAAGTSDAKIEKLLIKKGLMEDPSKISVAQGLIDNSTDTSSSDKNNNNKGADKNIYAALKEDNLQVVEGIGPKMNEVLINAGVKTWSDLSNQTEDGLRTILNEAGGDRYRIVDPSTWASQASYAARGDWDGLIAAQKNLSGGKAGGSGSSDAKVEKILIKMGVLKRWKQDDLTAVEGIGPKIAGLMRENGVNTWREMSETSVERLQEILKIGGDRFRLADPNSWPKQAGLAADGEWDKLKEYQDFLDGGK